MKINQISYQTSHKRNCNAQKMDGNNCATVADQDNNIEKKNNDKAQNNGEQNDAPVKNKYKGKQF